MQNDTNENYTHNLIISFVLGTLLHIRRTNAELNQPREQVAV